MGTQLKISPKNAGWVMIGILIIDLLGAGLAAYDIRGKEIWNSAEDLSVLIDDKDIFRIYSPSYSVEQHLAARYDLELTDGVDPMQLAAYVDFMKEATGVSMGGYFVTIPPFKTGNPSVDNIGYLPDSYLLGLLNVKYLISEFEINSTGLERIQDHGDHYLYANTDARPRAWIESTNESGQTYEAAKIINYTPNSIQLEAAGPGELVISEINYPGWLVTVDGKRADNGTSYGVLRSVSLGEGEHQVEFQFRPISTYIGIFLAAVGWIFVVYDSLRNRDDN
jgi:hypothetical protein